ncbi:type VI secretion system Vgr family protein [Providencia rettgeri]|uniref:type VI secretion system Vgr family protein n=1 Tax=Providencia rettgeri TaxID=587 RepID=UPI00200A3405|nr:type VI secretion system tip protein TssI/VgrG [Providencia rettgeri]UPS61441.1 type VI secretion system tip protein VgrG [Providencia rettgeri]
MDGLVFTCQFKGVPPDTFAVTEFQLTEHLSELFTLSLTAVSALPSIPFDDMLGFACSLTVTRNGKPVRTVRGLLASAEQQNTDGNRTWYHFIIRPEIWVMSLGQNSRIFRRMTVPDLLQQLLSESHIKASCKFYAKTPYPQRDYITQKRESNYQFFCRLAAEEGISFWFEDTGREPRLFYSDSHLGMTSGIDLVYNPQYDTDTQDHTAYHWRYRESLLSGKTLYKDYNPERPSYPLEHELKGDIHGQHPFYESYGRFQTQEDADRFTALRHEGSQQFRCVGSATTNCFALMPGKIFSLSSHPSLDMNRPWQVVSVSHHGVQPLADNSGGEGTTLSNQLTFIPSELDWRPPFIHKPTADGDELATVVGPDGEEIYTNKDGAVKIYFHWDRYREPDLSSSCWVRVAQGWNGDGYGFMAIPRIGQEVLVSYLNGDIDRPIITGCTYNGRNVPPLNLPNEMTRTTFKTKTHKGDGFNELRFEDRAGQEEIYFHAQRDMNVHIEHDTHWHVQHDAKHRIDNDRFTEIAGNEHLVLKGSQKENITGSASLHIEGDQQTQVDGKTVHESSQQTHLVSGGKIILEANTEITLKVGGSFIRITPGTIFTSSDMVVGGGSAGSGAPVALELPDGVAPFEQPPYPVKKYCAMAAQQAGGLTVKPNEDE